MPTDLPYTHPITGRVIPKIDISLLSTRPSNRGSDRVDLFVPLAAGGWESIAYNILEPHANAIIDAINERDRLQDLLADLLHDLIIDQPSTPALAAARSYLSTHRP